MERAIEEIRAAGVEVLTEGLEQYGRDETMDLYAAPGAVVRPRTTDEVRCVLNAASAHGVFVTPRGGGTGKAGGAIPIHGGLVLSLERMNKIREIDAANRFAVVQPGVILQELHEACEVKELLYPVDMSSRGSCQIGGNLACNAGGERAVKYGTTRNFCPTATCRISTITDNNAGGDFRKGSITIVLIQKVIIAIICYKQIEVAIVVNICPTISP